jgi:hypothetical protein
VKRSAADVIRRGLEITVANWPLLLIRIGEHLLLVLMAIASIVAIVVPVAISAGLGKLNIDAPSVDMGDVILALLVQHWTLWLFILVVITFVLIVFVAIHSFVQAGSADVYIANEFTADLWIAGGKRGWLRIFWIYNIAWLYAGVVLLIPIIPVPFIIILSGESTGAIVAGCVLLALWAFFAILVGLATALWTMKAIALAMIRNLDARRALAEARHAIRSEIGAHFAVGFVMLVIWFGGSALIGMVTGVMSMGHATPLAIITAPAHIALSFVNAIFSAAIESWLLASFIAMTES